MKSSHTFTILFWINTTRSTNGLAELYVRITVNGKRANIALKRKVPINKWDTKTKSLKGTSKSSKQVNQLIDQTKAKIYEIYQELYYKEQLITANLIKAKLNGIDENSRSLQEILKYHNNKIKNVLAPGSIRNFGVTEKYINAFLKSKLKTSDIYLKELNYKFVTDFEIFLNTYYPKGHPKAMSQNTVMKHIQRTRKIVTLAYHLDWINKDPFLRWKPCFEKRERAFLSENELTNLISHDFPLDRLDRVRDLFIFSCFTGISYVDIIQLRTKHIAVGIDGNKWIITQRQKTKNAIRVPLLLQAEAIINKYANHPVTSHAETLLPVISNEKVNLYLKEIADAVGITKNLTFHMARHTFATTITLSNGVPIETVSKMLGHTKIATTQIYARVLDQKVSEDMAKLRGKLC